MTSKVHNDGPRPPLIVVLGPTAGGKTAFAVELATSMLGRAEIVNADSRQLYCGLDIGTAKIRPDEMRGIPHHLLDVLDPRKPVTIAWYKERATLAIEEILSRGHVPILVGGSMLYLSSVMDGLEPLPPGDPKRRQELEREYDRDEGMTLHTRLVELDPESTSGIPRENKVYLIRALEIAEMTGMRPSQAKFRSACPYDLMILGLDLPKEELDRRIAERTARMFDDGWVAEVRSLLARGCTASDPGMQSLGYREIIAALESGGPIDRSALQATIAAKSRAYAKRQRTWWRGDPRIRWLCGSAAQAACSYGEGISG